MCTLQHGFEFLDLSEVDEVERSRVLTSLQYNGPNVQLPWHKRFSSSTNLKKITVKSSVTSECITNNQILNNNFVQNTANELTNNLESTAGVKSVALDDSNELQNGDHYKTDNNTLSNGCNNGVSSPANKSWASLFNTSKLANEKSSSETIIKNNAFNNVAVNKESNIINDQVCPIKYPKRGDITDPDCYRMGEYLLNYTVDGRAISLQPRGLINQSNYCYINSILQALLACPPVYNLLSGLAANISSNEKRKPTPVIDGMCRFVKEFQHLPAGQRVNRRTDKQKKDQTISINYDSPFEPSWIYRMLNGIRSDLIEGRQEDAEEFLGCLLNGLNDEMLEVRTYFIMYELFQAVQFDFS